MPQDQNVSLTFDGSAGSATPIIDRLFQAGICATWSEEHEAGGIAGLGDYPAFRGGIKIQLPGGGMQVMSVGDTCVVDGKGLHGFQLIPVDRRPVRLASAGHGTELVFEQDGVRRVFRQIGWHGASGRFYAIGEHPCEYERGSFSPLWIIAHTDTDIEPRS